MKNITNHLGAILLTLAAITLCIGIISFTAPDITGFFGSLIDTTTEKSEDMLDSISKPSALPPSASDLEAQHKFDYYSSFGLAISDVNAGTIGENADVDRENAVAGVCVTDKDETYVALFKDATETATTTITEDVTVLLDGHMLSYSNTTTGIDTVADNGNTITIQGYKKGSGIEINNPSGAAYTIQMRTQNDLVMQYGTYTAEGSGNTQIVRGHGSAKADISNCELTVKATSGNVRCLNYNTNTTLNISDCTIKSYSETGSAMGVYTNTNSTVNYVDCDIKSTSSAGESKGVYIGKDSTVNISNCDVTALSNASSSYGVHNTGDSSTNLSHCKITALSDASSSYGVYIMSGTTATVKECDVSVGTIDKTLALTNETWTSWGIYNHGTMSLENCNVTAPWSAVQTVYGSNLYVDGGTYLGYSHGGFYFLGEGTEEYYINNATLLCRTYSDVDTGFDTAFYVGGDHPARDVKVYMNNCTLDASLYIGVLRDTDGEHDNTVYFSNCKAVDAKTMRIDNDTHKVYIGKGCNFTASDATIPEAVVQTDDVYVKQ